MDTEDPEINARVNDICKALKLPINCRVTPTNHSYEEIRFHFKVDNRIIPISKGISRTEANYSCTDATTELKYLLDISSKHKELWALASHIGKLTQKNYISICLALCLTGDFVIIGFIASDELSPPFIFALKARNNSIPEWCGIELHSEKQDPKLSKELEFDGKRGAIILKSNALEKTSRHRHLVMIIGDGKTQDEIITKLLQHLN